MRIVVDTRLCDFHGQCQIAAPAVFELRASGELAYASEVDDSLRQDVEDAVDACPTQAIRIEE